MKIRMENITTSNEKLIRDLHVENLHLMPQSMNLSITLLNNILLFIYKQSTLRTRRTLRGIKELITIIDTENLQDQPEYWGRIHLIKLSVHYATADHVESVGILKEAVMNDTSFTDLEKNIMLSLEGETITYDDSKKLLDLITDRLNYGYSLQTAKLMNELVRKIDQNDYRSCKSIEKNLLKIARTVVAYYNRNSLSNEDVVFSLQKENFETSTEYAYRSLTANKNKFITGMRYFNIMVSPGIESGRLYVFIAPPGGGKSQLLLSLALQIRKHNVNINQAFPDKIPACIYISLENKFDESFERLYHIAGLSGKISDYSLTEVRKQLRDGANLKLTKEQPMDIYMFRKRRGTLDIDELQSMYNKLLDDGVETVVMVIDYLGLMKSSKVGAINEQERLKDLTDNLKLLSEDLNIPIITAHQVNRIGGDVVGIAKENNNYDLASKLRNSHVAGAWSILENADLFAIVLRERHQISGRLYLGINLGKKRYYEKLEGDEAGLEDIGFFAQPFEENNEIALIEDIDSPYALALTTLKPTVDDITDNIKGRRNNQKKGKEAKEQETLKTPNDYLAEFGFPID